MNVSQKKNNRKVITYNPTSVSFTMALNLLFYSLQRMHGPDTSKHIRLAMIYIMSAPFPFSYRPNIYIGAHTRIHTSI